MTEQYYEVRETGNRLLNGLAALSHTRVSDLCERVNLERDQVLFDPHDEIEYVHFPIAGCLSLVRVMNDGDAVEIGTIGFEGLSAVSAIHLVPSMPARCFVQIEGEALCLPRRTFEQELLAAPEAAAFLLRYAQAWSDHIGISATCNAVHSVEARCARWLLMTHDRMFDDVLPLKQEFLAIMLGVRRPSVTIAASNLQKAGLISYSRGRIVVVDRAGLEAASCECYGKIRKVYRGFLPARTGQPA